ncbi:MAG: GGDEF domain-containing protein [Candidatus Omnitrophica bacterium]|nr:GGDEF domain-containing protein [Candidatus Omnitrophota bacterium]
MRQKKKEGTGYVIFSPTHSFNYTRYNKAALKQEARCKVLVSEFEALSSGYSTIKADNLKLGKEISETIALYEITKDICKSLDEEKIFAIFKERIKSYIKTGDCRFLNKDADLALYKDYTVLPLVIGDERIGYLIASDISQNSKDKFQILGQQFLIGIKRALLYKKIQELAIMDGLTQVFSRRHFLERFQEELTRSRKFKHNLSFLMVDIDRFKDFNDKYGHLVGDAILRETAKEIKEAVRQIDFVGRYGGEELSIVLAETNKEQAHFAAERIRKCIESKNIKVYDEELHVTISIGFATFPDDNTDSSMLIEAADKALYLAKQTGRNKACAY